MITQATKSKKRADTATVTFRYLYRDDKTGQFVDMLLVCTEAEGRQIVKQLKHLNGRWSPEQFRSVGGRQISHGHMNPEIKAEIEAHIQQLQIEQQVCSSKRIGYMIQELTRILDYYCDTRQNAHTEQIICPECNLVQQATVEHTIPWNTYIHTCTNCKYVIMESEWTVYKKDEEEVKPHFDSMQTGIKRIVYADFYNLAKGQTESSPQTFRFDSIETDAPYQFKGKIHSYLIDIKGVNLYAGSENIAPQNAYLIDIYRPDNTPICETIHQKGGTMDKAIYIALGLILDDAT